MTTSTLPFNNDIERLRNHLERHKHRTGLYVSTDGLTALFEEVERLRDQQREAALDALFTENHLKDQVATLKAQVERLLANEATRITETLLSQGDHLQ